MEDAPEVLQEKPEHPRGRRLRGPSYPALVLSSLTHDEAMSKATSAAPNSMWVRSHAPAWHL